MSFLWTRIFRINNSYSCRALNHYNCVHYSTWLLNNLYTTPSWFYFIFHFKLHTVESIVIAYMVSIHYRHICLKNFIAFFGTSLIGIINLSDELINIYISYMCWKYNSLYFTLNTHTSTITCRIKYLLYIFSFVNC